jgi:hypothetical protein
MDATRRERIQGALLALTQPGVSKEAILGALSTLDAEVKLTDSGLPGDLDHYLRRRSYEKALLYLQGQKPSAGTCGRGA